MGYTLGQFQAFGEAVAKLENEKLRHAMMAVRFGGDTGKGYDRMMKALGG